MAQPDPPRGASPQAGPHQPAPPGTPTDGRAFPCERCGADLAFSPAGQSLRCAHCGFERPLVPTEPTGLTEHDLAAALREEAARRTRASAAPGAQEATCVGCGATVTFEGTLTATRCAYCDLPLQRDAVHRAPDRIPVDGLLTFAVEGTAARGALAAWVRSLWLAPGDFVRAGVDGRLDGIYLPYFTFDAAADATFRGERGDHEWVEAGLGQSRRRERRTRWSPASGRLQRRFDDVLVAAVTALPQPLLQGLEPWPLAAVRPFAPEPLAGKLAHTYDLELGASSGVARQRMEAALAADARARIGGDEQRIHALDTTWTGVTYKHLLLPVWLMAYRYGGKPYRVVVNATTGEVSGERPWSPWKVGLLVVAAIVLFALFASQSGR